MESLENIFQGDIAKVVPWDHPKQTTTGQLSPLSPGCRTGRFVPCRIFGLIWILDKAKLKMESSESMHSVFLRSACFELSQIDHYHCYISKFPHIFAIFGAKLAVV